MCGHDGTAPGLFDAVALFIRMMVLLLTAVPAAGCASGSGPSPPTLSTITVTAEGKVMAAPDTVLVHVGVDDRAQSLADVTAAVARRMSAVLTRVKALGVAERDIATVSYVVEPLTAPRRSEAEVASVLGYRAVNVVQLRLRDLPRAGAVVDAAVAAGANTVSALRFTIDDPARLEAEARALAVKAAATKARQLAEAAGVRLGPVESLTEGPMVRPVVERFSRGTMATAVAGPGPIEPGQLEIAVSVEMRYRIDR